MDAVALRAPAGEEPHAGEGREIVGEGTPEAAWRSWRGLAQLPRAGLDELVPPGRRTVIVAPHPDDEVLGAGGLLSALAERRREVLIIGVTEGEGSHPGSALWPRDALAARRGAERSEGLRALGLAAGIERLGYADGQLASDIPGLTRRLGETLRQNDVVFATWACDGHPDHEAVGQAAARACAARGARLLQMPVWMWHWAQPGSERVPWQRALRFELGDAALARKRAAIACHRSQLEADATRGAPPILSTAALARWLRPYEVFFT